ncbi:hypothetical protein CDAR_522811 [Caerostris darwini]|uniref:Uncharacterized protein n=1 Tax=Caerostris darwini TaxID=1538125 RepID=A0AAV4TAJ6_9ARAC|nr:hypothetical protein CDAR_522811 [Caerostris darwini]
MSLYLLLEESLGEITFLPDFPLTEIDPDRRTRPWLTFDNNLIELYYYPDYEEYELKSKCYSSSLIFMYSNDTWHDMAMNSSKQRIYSFIPNPRRVGDFFWRSHPKSGNPILSSPFLPLTRRRPGNRIRRSTPLVVTHTLILMLGGVPLRTGYRVSFHPLIFQFLKR